MRLAPPPHAFAGNINDSTEFRSITEELAAHYRQLAESCGHITPIFDKGNNSGEAFASLQTTTFHFVGSLVPSHRAELPTISRTQFRALAQPGRRGSLSGIAQRFLKFRTY